jgi:hypothetical protein
MLKGLGRVQALIPGEWGMTLLTAKQRRDLLAIVDRRQVRASAVVTSQSLVAIADPLLERQA